MNQIKMSIIISTTTNKTTIVFKHFVFFFYDKALLLSVLFPLARRSFQHMLLKILSINCCNNRHKLQHILLFKLRLVHVLRCLCCVHVQIMSLPLALNYNMHYIINDPCCSCDHCKLLL